MNASLELLFAFVHARKMRIKLRIYDHRYNEVFEIEFSSKPVVARVSHPTGIERYLGTAVFVG